MFFSLNSRTQNKPVTRRTHRPKRGLQFETMENRTLMAGLVTTTAFVPSAAIVQPFKLPSAHVAIPVTMPTISATQQQNIAKLRADVIAIRASSQVTPEQLEQLANDVVTLVKGTTKPSQESVEKLKTDLQTTLSDGKLTKAEQLLLANDVSSVLTSANVPITEIKAVMADAKAIIDSSGVTKSTLATIQTDIKAIVTEFHTQHPNT